MAAPTARGGLVVVGGSAGSIEALALLVAGLPEAFSAPLLVTVHVAAGARSFLPEILSRAGRLPAAHARDGERLRPGRVYVAPPDRHLLVEDGRVRLTGGPRENGHRPSIDALFRSAAQAYQGRVIGALLSGALTDGVNGLWTIKRAGGTTIVQDPSEALFASMPASALGRVDVDFTLPAAEIGALLASLDGTAREAGTSPGDVASSEHRSNEPDPMDASEASVFGCPDCGGVLWERRDGDLVRYRCRVGHEFSEDGLEATQRVRLEDALWAALRALDENTELSTHLAERSRGRGLKGAAQRFDERARTSREQSTLIRSAIEQLAGAGTDAGVPEPLRGEAALDRESAS